MLAKRLVQELVPAGILIAGMGTSVALADERYSGASMALVEDGDGFKPDPDAHIQVEHTDLHHLFAARGNINGSRGDLPFGELPPTAHQLRLGDDGILSDDPGARATGATGWRCPTPWKKISATGTTSTHPAAKSARATAASRRFKATETPSSTCPSSSTRSQISSN